MILGSMVALVTPMRSNQDIDWEALNDLIEWHLESGTDALVILGTTGESAVLSSIEKTELLKFVMSKTEGKIAVIAGTGSNSTRETIRMTGEAKAMGVDACLLVVPYYNCPGQEGIFQHYMAVAEAVSVPQVLYNVPGRTVADMQTETVVRLMEHPNIVGLKEATGDMRRAKDLISATSGKDFAIYSGDDATACDLLELGGHGVISVTANVAPVHVQSMCKLVREGNIEAAQKVAGVLRSLNEALFAEANPIPVKFALHKMGKIREGIRLPLTYLDESSHKKVLDALARTDIVV